MQVAYVAMFMVRFMKLIVFHTIHLEQETQF